MTSRILIVSGPDQGLTFPLLVGNALLGRSSSTRIRLSDPTVSRQHARIETDDTGSILFNLSTFGTLVNGKSITEHPLVHGDLVRTGATEFRFEIVELSNAETALQPAPDAPSTPS